VLNRLVQSLCGQLLDNQLLVAGALDSVNSGNRL
jgi:hypothetical protein